MIVIKYRLCNRLNIGTEENPNLKELPGSVVEIRCDFDFLKPNEEIAKREAYNGEYTVEEVKM